MERGRIIDRLIAIKARQGGGSAFRPAREAAMMRALAERHRGRLPLDTVEGIWRIIISTFTYVQANYSVHVDMSRGDAPMRDSARFHFGFTVPCVAHHSAGGVIDAVARGSGDLGMFAVDGGVGAGAWWTRLCPPARAQNHRAPAVRRAAGSSGRHAGFCHRQAAGGRRGAATSSSRRCRSTDGAAIIPRRSAPWAARSSAMRRTAWACRC